ncbi:MAG: 2Fe-2S iron-sulfur cluster binding domain-containing protein [Lentisphaeria bacterium]|nr:2Fe-2S iron-sulfur cluster binding domain-containing protein [Lentisphaeria bacterium]
MIYKTQAFSAQCNYAWEPDFLGGPHMAEETLFCIDINAGERMLQGRAGETLFQALKRQDFYLPSACGGQGKCGMCRLRIMNKVLPEPSAAEQKLLSEQQLALGWRLACQTKLCEDLKIELPKAYYEAGEYLVRITAKIALTKDIILLRCQAVEPRLVRLEAGCWMQWVIPVKSQDGEPCLRAFSLASDPKDQRNLEFIIKKTPCGIGTAWIFDQAQLGDTLTLRGPNGDFHLHNNQREAVFVAGGSGLSAIRSILLDMCSKGVQRKVRLFFGARHRRDLYMLDELAEIEKKLPQFQFIPALSDPLPEEQWLGESGLVTELLDKYYQDCSGMEAYLCGSPAMLQACVNLLQNKGMPPENIFFDKFVSSC